jgi:hypothetical protein
MPPNGLHSTPPVKDGREAFVFRLREVGDRVLFPPCLGLS